MDEDYTAPVLGIVDRICDTRSFIRPGYKSDGIDQRRSTLKAACVMLLCINWRNSL